MAEAPQKNSDLDVLIKKLMGVTGISEIQATELIALLGTNWSSLVREARLLKGGRNLTPK